MRETNKFLSDEAINLIGECEGCVRQNDWGDDAMEYCKQCVRHTFILKDLFEKKERTPNE